MYYKKCMVTSRGYCRIINEFCPTKIPVFLTDEQIDAIRKDGFTVNVTDINSTVAEVVVKPIHVEPTDEIKVEFAQEPVQEPLPVVEEPVVEMNPEVPVAEVIDIVKKSREELESLKYDEIQAYAISINEAYNTSIKATGVKKPSLIDNILEVTETLG